MEKKTKERHELVIDEVKTKYEGDQTRHPIHIRVATPEQGGQNP